MKNSWYKQCSFVTETEEGLLVETAWIPEHLAVVGKKIYFGNKTNKPDYLWTVTMVSDHRMSGQYLQEHERDYKTQRQASDI